MMLAPQTRKASVFFPLDLEASCTEYPEQSVCSLYFYKTSARSYHKGWTWRHTEQLPDFQLETDKLDLWWKWLRLLNWNFSKSQINCAPQEFLPLGRLNKYESEGLEKLKKELKASIQKGVDFVKNC